MEYVDGKGNWGYCNEKCLINRNLSTKTCFFNEQKSWKKISHLENNGTKCLTTNENRSPSKGKPCIYEWYDPWTNRKHMGCANPDKDKNGLWCPTQVDDEGYFVKNSKHYGFCNDYCLERGKICSL